MNVHSDRVFSVPEFLSPAECDSLISVAERRGFETATVRMPSGPQLLPSIRTNERVVLVLPEWTSRLWERTSGLDLPRVKGRSAVGLPEAIRFYKYGPGQRFKMHKDGPTLENGLRSELTLLVYLNEGFEGGETDFRDFAIRPTTGMALLFIHDTWHEGAEVTAGTKYVLRSDVMYGSG